MSNPPTSKLDLVSAARNPVLLRGTEADNLFRTVMSGLESSAKGPALPVNQWALLIAEAKPGTLTNVIVFIAGQQWASVAYYNYYYRPAIERLIRGGAKFVLGAAKGVDAFAQAQLSTSIPLAEHASRVTVFNKRGTDDRFSQAFALRADFNSYADRDAALALSSSFVLAFTPQMGGATSGVLQSVLMGNGATFDPLHPNLGESMARNVLKKTRAFSEPSDHTLLDLVAKVYDEYYTRKLAERKAAQQ